MQTTTVTSIQILRELKQLPPHKLQEVLDFARFLRQRTVVTTGMGLRKVQPQVKLMDFAGTLHSPTTFGSDPAELQLAMRHEWD